MYRMEDKSTYKHAHIITSGFLIGALILTFILRFCLVMENRRREHLSSDGREREAKLKEPCDWVNTKNVFM